MSGIAKMPSKKLMAVDMPKYEALSDMHLNLKKHKGMDMADVGKKIHFKGHGVITSIHKDESGHSMRIDIRHIQPHKGEKENE